MTDEVKHLIDVMAMLDRCRETSCCKCEQLEFNGMIACNDEITVYRHAAKLLEAFSSELEQVKRERDAYYDSMQGICATCKKARYCMLNPLPKCPNWQWRGVKEE